MISPKVSWFIFLLAAPASAGVSHHSGFVSLASPETYLEACAAADVQWFKTNYPNFIEPHSVNQATPLGESCAHLSAFNSDQTAAVEVLRRFLNSGGRFNNAARNKVGANPTALAVNIVRGNLEAVELLVHHNVDMTKLFRNGNDASEVKAFDVAIEAAAGKGEDAVPMKIARLLEAKGAKSTSGRALARPPPPPAPPPVEVEEVKEEVEEEEVVEEVIEEVVEVQAEEVKEEM